MTDDLSTKLAVLTEDRPEPSDPAAPVRLRIERRRRRRGAAIVVASAAAATAAAVAIGPLLGSLQPAGSEPGVAGFTPPTMAVPTVAPPPGSPVPPPVIYPITPPPGADHTTVMPPPWSAEVFTKMPDANAYLPKAYYVAKGTIPAGSWAMLAFSQIGCMVSDEGPANSFGRPYICFNQWRPGQRAAYYKVQGHVQEKDAAKTDHTLVFGAASADARKVEITAGGKTYTADAVGTPATDKLRFFALIIPRKDLTVTAVTPLDAAGKLADPPTGVPAGERCSTDPDPGCGSTAATPAK